MKTGVGVRVRTGSVLLVWVAVMSMLAPSEWPALAATCTAGTQSDFNGDGTRDVAIADPEATVAGVPGAGLVRVVYGGGKGTSEISQATAGMNAAPEADDRFGMSMAVYDADKDGCSDLVVGVPNEDVGTLTDAGAIYVIHGTPTGIGAGSAIERRSQQGLDSTSTNEAYDWFGFALAAGQTSSGDPFLLVGSPGENVGDAGDAGMFHYVRGGTATAVHQDTAGIPGAPETDDRYGYSLTATSRYFAVGTPGEAIGTNTFAGAVAVFNHTLVSGVPTAIASPAQDQAEVPGGAETGDGFGMSVAAVGYRPPGASSETDMLLAIGIPGEDVGTVADAGGVLVLDVTSTGTFTATQAFDRSVEGVEGDAMAGDLWGQRVALANLSPGVVGTASTMWLAVAAPGHDTESAKDAGSVTVAPALGVAPGTNDKLLTRGGGILPGTATARDYTGMSLTGTSTALYVGVPYSKAAGQPKGVVYAVPWVNIISSGTATVTSYRPGAGGLPDVGKAFSAVAQ